MNAIARCRPHRIAPVPLGTLTAVFFLASAIARADGPTPAATTTSVYGLVVDVENEIELLRLEMGKPLIQPLNVHGKGVAPDQLWLQAMTLDQKVDQLFFEHVRERAPEAPQSPEQIGLGDISALVSESLDELRLVKRILGVTEMPAPTVVKGDKTVDELFDALLQASRRLNGLLDRQWKPSEVFEQVTLAVGYASDALSQLPGATPIPTEPPLVRRMRPVEVFLRLVACFDLMGDVFAASGLSAPRLVVGEIPHEQIVPSDVYDVAALIVTELRLLLARSQRPGETRRAFAPGNKLPSHVYQRAGILEEQLKQLKRRVVSSPTWLKREP